MKVRYFYSVYGEINEDLQQRVPYLGNYVYILNISGSDVCKIGIASNVFNRIKQLRQLVRSIFPFIENSITYNVYISAPLKDDESKRKLESDLHKIYQDYNIDGEWFKYNFDDIIKNLRELEFNYLDSNKLKYILSLFNDDIYHHKLFIDDFFKLKSIKPIQELHFGEFAKNTYPNLFKKDIYSDLSSPYTETDIINVLKNFLNFIKNDFSNSNYRANITTNNKSSYKREATKKINSFIDKYSPQNGL